MYERVGQDLQKGNLQARFVNERIPISSRKGSKKPTPHNLTCKSMEDLIVEIMEANKIIKTFQVMAIVNYKMGNLRLQIDTLTNRLPNAKQENQKLQKLRKKGAKAQAILKHMVSAWKKEKSKAKVKINVKNISLLKKNKKLQKELDQL